MQPRNIRDGLEPIYGIEVAAELCGVTSDAFKVYVHRYFQDLEPHYLNDGSPGRGKRVFYQDEIIRIRKQMMSGKQRQYYKQKNNKYIHEGKKKALRWDRPTYDFLTS